MRFSIRNMSLVGTHFSQYPRLLIKPMRRGCPPPIRILIGYIIPILILYRRLLFEGHIWLDFDYLIDNRVRFEILQSGLLNYRIPLWSDSYLGGFPIAFSEFGWFYPISWFFLFLFPMPLAYHIEAAIGLLLAAVSTYLLGRAWGMSRMSAFVGGYTYALSPFVFATSLFINFADVFWVLPATLLALERVAQRHYQYLVLFVVAAAAGILSGHPHIVLVLAFAASIFTVFRVSWVIRDHGFLVATGFLSLLVFGTIVAFMMGAVRILPSLALTEISTRAGGIEFADAAAGAFHPLQLILGYVYPAFDLPLIADGILRAEPLAYLGLLAVPMAMGAIIWRAPQRPVFFLTFLLAVSWVLACGDITPVYGVLHSVPVFELFREPGRYLLPGILAMALLVGFGLDRLRSSNVVHEMFSRRIALAFATYAVVVLAFLILGTILLKSGGPIRDLTNRVIDRFMVGGQAAYFNEAGWLGSFALVRARLDSAFTLFHWTPVFSVLTAGGIAVIFSQYGKGRLPATSLHVCACVLIIADISLSIGHGIPTVPPEISSAVPAVSTNVHGIRNGRIFSFRSLADKAELGLGSGRDLPAMDRRLLEYIFLRELITPNLFSRYGLRSIDGYENLMSTRQAEVLSYVGSERTTIPGFALDDSLSEEVKVGMLHKRLSVLAALGVTTVIAGTDLSSALGPATFSHRVDIPFDWEGPLVWVYKIPGARGDFYLTSDWVWDDLEIPTTEALDRIVENPSTTLVDGNPGFDTSSAIEGSVELLSELPGRWKFLVHSNRPNILVLNQAAFPGWQVFLNGHPGHIFTANRFGMAVVVPPGRVEVAFDYFPPYLKTGIVTALAGLAILLAMGTVILLKARSQRHL